MSGGTTTIEEMIAQCARGIYVHRLSTISVVDGYSGMLDGFTRDGCLLIKDGAIKGPTTDFRFHESPVFAFNRVLALGTPRRVAFGFTPRDAGATQSWPYAPVIAPPIMVRDFNFSALADSA
jgi:predicted Zn-dependent protease